MRFRSRTTEQRSCCASGLTRTLTDSGNQRPHSEVVGAVPNCTITAAISHFAASEKLSICNHKFRQYRPLALLIGGEEFAIH